MPSMLIRLQLFSRFFIVGFMITFIACAPAATHRQYLSAEDEVVLELVERISKNPNDQQLLNQLPKVYGNSMDSREQMKGYVLKDNPAGDRWALWAKQLEASQFITNSVMKLPQASSLITSPRYYTAEIQEARSMAAEEYYNLGLEYLNYNNRPYAQKALEMFQNANSMVPGFKDVSRLINEAERMAQLVVVVNPVDYYNYGWNYWGFNNDYLQWQMLNDLNRQSWRNVRFYSYDDARRMGLHPDRTVELRFTRLMVYSPYQDRYQVERTAQVPAGDSRPPANTKPAMQTVKATVFVTRRIVRGEAELLCNIYDQVGRRTIFGDRFPGRYQWEQKTATYTGDKRALTNEDLQLINNRFQPDPSRSSIAQRLINDSYQRLISRIQQAVNFSAD